MTTISKGTVYWITGLSGAGKTTIGKLLYEKQAKIKPNVIFLDGDILREVFGSNFGHSLEDRRKLAMSYSRLCKMLSDQNIDVVCATLSLFKEIHSFNRLNIENYYEIFIYCDIKELIRRDQKGIYSKSKRGEIKDVIGIDLPYDKPEECDLIIDNTVHDRLEEKANKIFYLTTDINKSGI